MSKVNREVVATRVVYLSQIVPRDDWNIRTSTKPLKGEQSIEELADSIRREGLISPLTVCKSVTVDCYDLMSGYRRFQAMILICKDGQIDTDSYQVNVSVKEYGDETAKLLGNFVENVRNSVRPADQARRFALLMGKPHELSPATISGSAGVSRSHVSNLSRCWSGLPEEITSHWANPELADLPMAELFKWVKLESSDEQLAAFHEYLDPTPEGGDGEGADEDGDGDGEGKAESAAPTKKEIKEVIGRLLEKSAKMKDKLPLDEKGKLNALQWVVGARKRL
jgi:ParB/RepB/Spo0J family partition protein